VLTQVEHENTVKRVSPATGEVPRGPHSNDARPNENTEARPEEHPDPASQDVAPLSHQAESGESLSTPSIAVLSVRVIILNPNRYC
jgi:hypothetical protein